MNVTTRPIVYHLRILAMGLGVWAGLVLLFATQFVLVGSSSWGEAFKQAVFFWGLWVVLTPVVVFLCFRFPFERRCFPRDLSVHLLACTLVVVVNQIAFRHFIPAPPPPSGDAHQDSPPAPDAAKPVRPPPGGFLSLRAGLDILVYWSLVGVGQAITNFRRSQQRERRAAELEARLTRSKLQALRMQINPHFLFNTLNAISTLIYVNPRAADEMLGDLSELLRHSLDSMNEQEVTLQRELQFIRAYISIEQKRFGERLRLEQNVPEGLLKAMVPALILQPLVENAIRHGIEPQRAPGLVTLTAERKGELLYLQVRDDGKGLPPEGTKGREKHGIGLNNTQARLREMYGTDQRFSFGGGEPRGCVVQIRIPYHEQPLEVAPEPAQQPETQP